MKKITLTKSDIYFSFPSLSDQLIHLKITISIC